VTDKKTGLKTESVTLEDVVEMIEAEKLPRDGIDLETAFNDISIPGAEPDRADIPTEHDAPGFVPPDVETLLPMLRDQIANIPGIPFHVDGSLDESKLNLSSEITAAKTDPTQPAVAESESVDRDLSGTDIHDAEEESDGEPEPVDGDSPADNGVPALDFSGIEINGAETITPESTDSDPFDSQDASETWDGQNGETAQSPTDTSDVTEDPSPAYGTSQNGSPVNFETYTPTSQGFRTSHDVDDGPTTSDKPNSSQTETVEEARAQTEPKLSGLPKHIRSPGEILLGPLYGMLGVIGVIGIGVKTITASILKAIGVVMELTSVLLLVCYLVTILIAFVIPGLGTPVGVTTIGGKIVFLGELGVVVILYIVVAFVISMLIDGVCNQGERYKPSPTIQQV
jgi:hypothetical protein